jgi:hypothetical protein
MSNAKRVPALTLLTLVVGVGLLSACSSDEPKSVTTTQSTVTHYDDGSSRSSWSSTTESHQ